MHRKLIDVNHRISLAEAARLQYLPYLLVMMLSRYLSCLQHIVRPDTIRGNGLRIRISCDGMRCEWPFPCIQLLYTTSTTEANLTNCPLFQFVPVIADRNTHRIWAPVI